MTELNTSAAASVTVTVIKDASGNVVITCSPDVVEVGAYNTLISFNLVSPGFKFRATNPIVLKAPSPDFPYPSWFMNNTLATLFDKCSTIATFQYTVYVVDIATGIEYNLDPAIKNGDASVRP